MNQSLLPQLWLCLDRRVEESSRAWLERAEKSSREAMPAAFSTVPRHVGRGPVVTTATERLALGACGVPVGLAEWRVDDLARAALLVGWNQRLEGREPDALVHELYEVGDPAARAALLRWLPLSSDGRRLLSLAHDGAAARERQCFAAIACANPYPAAHFGEERYTELVVRALMMEVRLERLVGLQTRASYGLRFKVARLVEERRSAGLGIPEDLALLEAPAWLERGPYSPV